MICANCGLGIFQHRPSSRWWYHLRDAAIACHGGDSPIAVPASTTGSEQP